MTPSMVFSFNLISYNLVISGNMALFSFGLIINKKIKNKMLNHSTEVLLLSRVHQNPLQAMG